MKKKEELKKWLNQEFGEVLYVVVLEDNKYEHSILNIKKSVFIEEIDKEEYIVSGIGGSEFSIILADNSKFTLQVNTFELDNEISFD